MKKLLHIIATPRGNLSRTLKIAKPILENFDVAYPEGDTDEIDLFKDALPELTVVRVGGKYTLLSGGELSAEAEESWRPIEEHINRFMSADIILISTPMWNFGIPYKLKHYIDIIVQPKYLFQYTEKGVEGLAKGKKVIVVSSRGGDYSVGTPAHSYDQVEPYLKTVLGFIGITDINFICAQPVDAGSKELRDERLAGAIRDTQAIVL
jgi:FMN-dependent NADH-azoreductase